MVSSLSSSDLDVRVTRVQIIGDVDDYPGDGYVLPVNSPVLTRIVIIIVTEITDVNYKISGIQTSRRTPYYF